MQNGARRAAWSAGPGAAREGRVVAFVPRPPVAVDPEAAAVARLVAKARSVPLALLLHRRRCKAPVADARMLAMYLVHVVLGRSYCEVGAVFGRDRTTVAHACARVEDLRDAPAFEAEVAALEAEIGERIVAGEQP